MFVTQRKAQVAKGKNHRRPGGGKPGMNRTDEKSERGSKGRKKINEVMEKHVNVTHHSQ